VDETVHRDASSGPPTPHSPLTFKGMLLWMLVAAISFFVAYSVPHCSALMVVFLFSLLQLARVRSSRNAMNIGWALGLAIYGAQLAFFWTIFGPGAITLWLVLAFWLGIFLVTARECHLRIGRHATAALAPVLWLGFEFFRSELYFLRFTWLNPGYAFSDSPLFAATVGVYGIGFLLMCVAAALDVMPLQRNVRIGMGALLVVLLAVGANLPTSRTGIHSSATGGLRVAGVQMEFPAENQVLVALEALRRQYPDTDLFVLSEYTFEGPVPQRVREWCRKSRKYLIAGGKDYLAVPADQRPGPDAVPTVFRNTAFVIGTNGDVVFKQAKAMPIQFFKDGLPAEAQRVWDSPWGRLGICICYDLSYAGVIDELARQQARALIVPTMDVLEWGERQHRLHARVPVTRAAEYGLPIVRVASSGISQLIGADATLLASANFAQEGGSIAGEIALPAGPRNPPDRLPGRVCAGAVAALLLVLGSGKVKEWLRLRRGAARPGSSVW